MTTPTPTPRRSVASSTLRRAGLVSTSSSAPSDKDTTMRDLTGPQRSSRRSHYHHASSGKAGGHRMRSEGPLSIRGASAGKDKDVDMNMRGPTGTAGGSSTMARIRRSVGAGVSNGVTPPGVRIRTSDGVGGGKTIAMWREFVKSRWNPDVAFLDLSDMLESPLVKANGLATPGIGGGTIKEASVIWKLAGELKPPVKTLDLSRNALSGYLLQSLAHYLPNLNALSLQNNNLKGLKDIDLLASGKKGKFTHLKELILLGNPIQSFIFGEKYRIEICRRFPTLTMLDQTPIATISFADSHSSSDPTASAPFASKPGPPSATTFPYPISPSLIAGVDPSLVSGFLLRFFTLFDSNRAALQSVYAEAGRGVFSYNVNTTIPTRAKIQGVQWSLPNQKKLTWQPWLDLPGSALEGGMGSRNLSRLLGNMDKQTARLHLSPQSIIHCLLALPGTKHDLESHGSNGEELFCIDCFPTPVGAGQGEMGLLISVHGQFEELPSHGLRSFDRTFIVVVAPDGSAAKADNWPIQIISDQLSIRAYSLASAWKQGNILVQAEPSTMPLSLPAGSDAEHPPIPLDPMQKAAVEQVPEPQRSLLVSLINRTRLNPKFAYECLHNNDWDFTRAHINFLEVRETLPSNAFL